MNRLVKSILIGCVLLALLSEQVLSGAAHPEAIQTRVDAWVLETAAKGETEFLVLLKDQADLSGAARLRAQKEKGRYVYRQLTETARRSQGPLLRTLKMRGVSYQPFWIANMVWVRGDASDVQAIANRADVRHVFANPKVFSSQVSQPRPTSPAKLAPKTSPKVPLGIEWSLTHVGAPLVWDAGYRGQGVVIGGQDTGYDWEHPALKNQYRGWNGTTADHNYNWHDAIHTDSGGTNPCGVDTTEPCDDNNHGTHTMGTMVGSDGTNQIGMAPAARWIGCRNMEQGWGSPASYSECYQWFLAPTDINNQNPNSDLAPNIINNSWGCPPAEGCTDPLILLTVVENVRAAGILTVHSAGNEGAGCSSVTSPGAIYDASLTVGNTTSSDMIADSSSRGPVTVDGSGRMKPDVVAPGSGIRSSIPGGGYKSMSGTSMAGPHVAGLAALLISAKPELAGQVGELETIIMLSAKRLTSNQGCGGLDATTTPNHVYGWGRIDAWNALQTLLLGPEPTPTVTPSPSPTDWLFMPALTR